MPKCVIDAVVPVKPFSTQRDKCVARNKGARVCADAGNAKILWKVLGLLSKDGNQIIVGERSYVRHEVLVKAMCKSTERLLTSFGNAQPRAARARVAGKFF
jgi:hypothetical protein